MKKIILILFILAISLQTNGQKDTFQKSQDSLYAIWKNNTQLDMKRVKAFETYIENGFLKIKPEEAIVLAEELKKYAIEKQYPIAEAIAQRLTGLSFMYKSNYTKAIDFLNLSVKSFEEIRDKNEIGQVLKNLGEVNVKKGNDSLALKYYNNSLRLFEEIDNKVEIGNNLLALGDNFLKKRKYSEALDYFNRSLQIFEEINDKKQANFAAYKIKVVFQIQGKFDELRDYLNEGIKAAEKTGNKAAIQLRKESIADSYNRQAATVGRRGNYESALKYQKIALKLWKELDNKGGISDCYNNIASSYYYLGNYALALEYSKKDLKLLEKLGDKVRIASNLSGISSIYGELGNSTKAIEYGKKSLELYKELDYKYWIAFIIGGLAKHYLADGNIEKALDYAKEALKFQEERKDAYSIAHNLSTLGNIYETKKDYNLALNYYKKALKINENSKNNMSIAYGVSAIANIYIIKKNYYKAIPFLKRGLQLSEDLKILPLQKEINQRFYDSYKNLGKSKEALGYIEKLRVIEDSISAQEMGKKLQQMEFAKQVTADSLATVEKERLVEVAHQEEVRKKNQTRNILFGIAGLILVIAGGIYSRLKYVRKSKAIIEKEKDRSENLLLNILPAEIAEELKTKGKADAREFEMVSILFTDFKGFTEQSAKLSAADLVNEINTCFEAFDGIMEKFGIEKIKTIGDAYMAAGGLPVPTDDSVKNTVLAAFEMQEFIRHRKATMDAKGLPSFQMRVGINTGPVVAGIVGVKKFQYDIWGDTVNTASRIESNGKVDKVNISQSTYECLKEDTGLSFESRGKIEVKGKGEIDMYFVTKNGN